MPFKTLQWNCRAISTARDLLIQHLANNNYTVVALQSLKTTFKKLPVLPGFHYPPYTKADNNGDVKVATYVAVGTVARYHTLPCLLEEGYRVAVSIAANNHQEVTVLNYYAPQGNRSFTWISRIPDGWLVIGDFNCRDALWEDEHPHANERIQGELEDADIVLMNDGSHTHIPDCANHSTSAIDLSFISPDLAGRSEWSVLDDSLSSDHLPITITIHVSPCIFEPKRPDKFNFKKADWMKFQNILHQADPPNMNEPIDMINTHITETILHAASQSIPILPNSKGRRGNPWWNDDCRKARVEKVHAMKMYKRMKHRRCTLKEIEKTHKTMVEAKAACKKTIAAAKLEFWRKSTETRPGEITSAWKRQR